MLPASRPFLQQAVRYPDGHWEVVCDEQCIGSNGGQCGDKDAHFGRIKVFHHEALGSKYVPRAVLFDLEPFVIGAVILSRRSANYSAQMPS
jgi:hypothetical protein